MKVTNQQLSYASLRVALGVNFLGHGAIRIYNGVGMFAAATAEHMTKSPLPHGLVIGFGYVIPWVELVLGLLLIAGWMTRAALVAGAIFMMMLTVGVTSNQQWDVAGQQLVYSAVIAVLLFLVEHNRFALDGWRKMG